MRKYLIFGGIAVMAGIVINYSLGGFQKIEAELISAKGSTIYGAVYEGGHSSDLLSDQIEHYRSIIDDSNQEGTLTIVNYMQTSLEKRGIIKQFIGIEWTNESILSEETMDSLVINSYNGFQFRLHIKPLVMPSPEKLKLLATEAAELMDNELLGYSIEQYKDGYLIINFPLK